MKMSKTVKETLKALIIGEQYIIIKHINMTKRSGNQLSETRHFSI